MKRAKFVKIAMLILVVSAMFSGCSSGPVTEQQTVAVVQRGDLEVKVTADGNIEMPDAVDLYFDTTMFTPPYSARVVNVYVANGDFVKAGAVLAKLDDTTQREAVEAAQYALELAMNNVVQTVCCGCTRVPTFYSDAVTLMRFEFAQKEMEKARVLLQSGKYEEASAQIMLAKYDLDEAEKFYSNPAYRTIRPDLMDVNQPADNNADIDAAIAQLSAELDTISSIQTLIKGGQYDSALDAVQSMQTEMTDTYSVVKRLNHLPEDTTYPDTCTDYTVVNEALSSLTTVEEMSQQKDVDPVKFAEALSLTRHDLELGNKILEENISTFRQGVNLQTLRVYNINVQSAIINLERSKQALLKTDLLAPFDGRVVDVNLHTGDLITQRYAVTGAPIDSYVLRLANTSYVRMTGAVDETDVLKIAQGQTAKIYVDAVPGKEFTGQVTFISPYGPQQAYGAQVYGTLQPTMSTYKVEIAMDPKDAVYLSGGLTATADILVDKRENVLIVPNSAITGKEGDYTVLVLKDSGGNVFEQRSVEIGLQNKSYTEIISGLTEGEKVILGRSNMPAKLLTRPK